MPYINQQLRDELDVHLQPLVEFLRTKPSWNIGGLLNYVFYKIAVSMWKNCRAYHTANSIVGAFECCSREFTRQHLDEYEDVKRAENGDVESFPFYHSKS